MSYVEWIKPNVALNKFYRQIRDWLRLENALEFDFVAVSPMNR